LTGQLGFFTSIYLVFSVIYGLLATESGAYIDKADMIRHVKEWESGYIPEAVAALFNATDKIAYEDFVRWIDGPNAECLGVSRWLLYPNPSLSLVNKLASPTFYQTLAGVTHLEEQEIVELEKRFWVLAGNSSANQIDLTIIKPLVSPPLPPVLVEAFFSALDENKDGQIDFKELSCGVSAACRGPEMERQKCN
jgi:ubiquitin carboxyl-terminal hydrolase 6/32